MRQLLYCTALALALSAQSWADPAPEAEEKAKAAAQRLENKRPDGTHHKEPVKLAPKAEAITAEDREKLKASIRNDGVNQDRMHRPREGDAG